MPANGLMAFWASIAPGVQAPYSRWHNNEHIPERLAVPGFLRGRRYRSVDDANRFLMYYDTAGTAVLTSAAYLAALNAPTPRTQAALRWFDEPVRSTYSRVADAGVQVEKAAPVIAVTVFTPPDAEDAARRSEALAALHAATAGASGARQWLEYRLDTAGTTVRTGEAAVHGAKASTASGLLVAHCTDLRLLDDEAAWAELRSAVERWKTAAGVQQTDGTRFYSLEFALENPTGKEASRGEAT